ncbi:MAG: TlpA family protein disulfide reductase [Clostridia bacterium]|nr:TlpA family protein disulfide reductase [Clostridia bacterium]
MKNAKFARPALIVAAVAVVFILAYLILSAVWKEEEPQYAIDITGVTADGKTLYSLSDNYGEQGTVLVFFNHNTGKAIEVLQQISKIAPEYDADVIAVATGEGTISEQIAIMEENDITVFPHTLFDLEGEMADAYNISGTPITYFIDKNGRIIDAYVASISEKSMRKTLEAIG